MRIMFRQTSAAILVCIGVSAVSAQTTIYGVDVRHNRFFKTDTGTFVASWVSLGYQDGFFTCIDFDETATTLWVADYFSHDYGTLDLSNGLYKNVGTIAGLGASEGPVGWTCDTQGVWWLTTYNSSTDSADLYTIDLGTGVATLVGHIGPGIQMDIAIDSSGNLYGHNTGDDALYSISTITGAGTYIGPTGYTVSGTQGMDFDWTDDSLYATVYTGNGTGSFVQFDLTTGAGILLESTTPLDAQMGMACQVLLGSEPGIPYCFCDQGNPSGNVSPCGNWNDGSDPKGAGCAHQEGSWGDQGARLHATGLASISGDTLVLRVSRGPLSNSTLFFQANNNLDGTGILLGDGISCAGGGLIRLKVNPSNKSGHVSSLPAVVSSKSAANGHTIVPGETLYYQTWFRDPNGSICGNESNTSNGYAITWLL